MSPDKHGKTSLVAGKSFPLPNIREDVLGIPPHLYGLTCRGSLHC